MRKVMPDVLERGRVTTGKLKSQASFGPYGMFHVPTPHGVMLTIMAAGADDPRAEGWEHVSVSTLQRCPTWEEMSWVKDLFWDEDEVVIQFHPPKSLHINCHPFCLHLWRNAHFPTLLPPGNLVGLKR